MVALLWLVGCGGGPHEPTVTPATPAAGASAKARSSKPDPDLHRPPVRKLLDIDWAKVSLTDNASALALWQRIAPTGADWDDRLEEIPAAFTRPLAVALLRGGNFGCAKPPAGGCAKPAYEVPAPAPAAGFDDPCLRRLLALWSIAQIDDDDVPAVKAALLAIAAIPPPESQLVAAAIHTIPEEDQEDRLAILAVAQRAGQRELVDATVGALDEVHLLTAVKQHHIGGALEILSAEAHRAAYLAALNDDVLPSRARTAAIADLVAADAAAAGTGPLPADLRTALVSAARTKDCSVAASAARVLDQHGDHRFVPRRPRTASVGQLMRAICVLASYEALQPSDEASLLASYLPPSGLQRTTVTYDPLSEDDRDGDGDPHTTHAQELVSRSEAVLPELEDLVRAMAHCTGAICVSDDHEFQFVWKRIGGELWLSRLDVADRPPCTERKAAKP